MAGEGEMQRGVGTVNARLGRDADRIPRLVEKDDVSDSFPVHASSIAGDYLPSK
jgi:hypothetical protein